VKLQKRDGHQAQKLRLKDYRIDQQIYYFRQNNFQIFAAGDPVQQVATELKAVGSRPESRPEQVFLVVEMAEERVFAHVGKARDFPGAGPVISLPGKQLCGRLHNFVSAL
jgi:hypothetical protein